MSSAAAALASLEFRTVDVVLTDLHMPVIDGVTLLEEVQRRWPDCVRIVLTGDALSDRLHGVLGIAHRVLGKPCAAAKIVEAIEGTASVRERLFTRDLLNAVTGIGCLPTPPRVYLAIQTAIRENRSLAEVGAILAADAGLATKVLQLVNSAWFGLRRTVDSPAQAASMLGISHLSSLVLALGAQRELDVASAEIAVELDEISTHASRIGVIARRLAVDCGLGEDACDEVFGAAVLMNVGELVIASRMPQQRRQVQALHQAEPGVRISAHERTILGATHGEIGALLLSLWGVPDVFVRVACGHQDEPDQHCRVTLLAAAAEALAELEGPRRTIDRDWGGLSKAVQRHGLGDRILAEFAARSGPHPVNPT